MLFDIKAPILSVIPPSPQIDCTFSGPSPQHPKPHALRGYVMFKSFTKLALSGATALSLALTPMSAQAAPDGEDVAKTLAGLAVLGIIASIASDRNNSRSSTTTATTNRLGSINGPRGQRVIDGEISRPNNTSDPKRKYKRVRLPDNCVRILRTSNGNRTVYGQRCLNRNYMFASQLPERCERQVRTNGRVRTFYMARCLDRLGWKVASN